MDDGAGLEAWLERVGPVEAFTALAGLARDVAVAAVDADGRVVHWGGDAERLLGWRREQLLGRPCPEGLLCDVVDGRPAPRPFGATARVRRRDGGWVALRQLTHLFADQEGRPLGALHLLIPEAADGPPASPGPPVAREAVRFHGLLTQAPAMLRAFDTIRNVAATDATVLVRGESGTGKELVARAVHAESPRRDGPFVAVNCGAIAPSLLEDDLFGHVKGAFTGADRDRPGIFTQADGGTLFLDEVAELSLDLQAKLLRVLQERTFVPLGGRAPVQVDVRVVAATHRSLREEVRRGRFREDLMYRLRVVPIFLPPLRERRQDVDLLLRHAIAEHNARGPRVVQGVAPDAMRKLLDHPWPGNVRELFNVVAYAFAVGRGPELTVDDLPPEFREEGARSAAPPPSVDPLERARIEAAIAEAGGDLGRAAEQLGMSRTTFWRRRRQLGLT